MCRIGIRAVDSNLCEHARSISAHTLAHGYWDHAQFTRRKRDDVSGSRALDEYMENAWFTQLVPPERFVVDMTSVNFPDVILLKREHALEELF